MSENDVTWRKVSAQLVDSLQQRFVVRNKDLDVIAKARQFSKRTDKIWHGPRRPVPNENRKPFAAQMLCNSATDDPKADHTNVLMR
jgi:hypothetical protein